MASLRQRGYRLIIYLDDILLMSQSLQEIQSCLATLIHMLAAMGFQVNVKKSILTPCTQLEFLGFLVDSKSLCLSLPEENVLKVQRMCQEMLKNQAASVQELAKFLAQSMPPLQQYCQLGYTSEGWSRCKLLLSRADGRGKI